MPSVEINDIPDDAYTVLQRRAAAEHTTLEEYLRRKLIAAARPTIDDILDRVGTRTGGSLPLRRSARIMRRERALR